MIVYSGTHNERNVVVKVLPKHYGAFEHESSSIEGKIVQFLGTRENEDFVELYIERCDFNFQDYFL